MLKVIKFLGKSLAIFLIGSLSVVLITAAAVTRNLTDRETIKSWPVEAGVYSNLTNSILNLANRGDDSGSESIEDALDKSALDEEGLKAVLRGVYAPEYWQNKFESVVDPAFDWLEGQAPELKFSIDFSDKRTELGRAVEAELRRQLATFPPCADNRAFDNFDPFKATCLPVGVSAREVAAEFRQELTGKDSFLAEADVTEQDLTDKDGQPVITPEINDNAPRVFAALSNLPYILGAALGLAVLLLVVSDKTPLHGLRKAGQLIFLSALVSWTGFYLTRRVLGDFSIGGEGSSSGGEFIAREVGSPLLKTIIRDITDTGLWLALAFIIFGILLWLGAFIWHKAYHHHEAENIANKAFKNQPPPTDAKLPKPVKDSSKNDN